MEYSIVIPAYNESDKITSSLTHVLGFMRDYSKSFEVLVVDDGSEDDTADLVEEYSKSNSEVRLVRCEHKGKGPTVHRGISEANGAYIYMADADFSTPITELRKLSTWIHDHDNDIVIASREGAGAVRHGEPFYRHLMGRVFNLVVQMLALPGIKDSQCGFKLFKGNVAKEVFGKMIIYSADAPPRKKAYFGAFDVEMLFIAKKRGYSIKELPVEWTYVRTTRLNPIGDSINMARDVAKVRLNSLKGLYK